MSTNDDTSIELESPLEVSPQRAAHHHIKLSPQTRRNLIIEFILGLIGLYGIGALLSGKVRMSVQALAFSALWLAIRLLSLTLTAGFAIFILLPLTMIFAVSHTVTLRRVLRQAIRAEMDQSMQ